MEGVQPEFSFLCNQLMTSLIDRVEAQVSGMDASAEPIMRCIWDSLHTSGGSDHCADHTNHFFSDLHDLYKFPRG